MPPMQRTRHRPCAAQPPSHRVPDRAGNPRRAHCEEAGVRCLTKIVL